MNSNEQQIDNNPSTSSLNFSVLTKSEGDQSISKEDQVDESGTPTSNRKSRPGRNIWSTHDCINLGD